MNVKVIIRDVRIDQIFLAQIMSTYLIILGQPYIMTSRIKMKVMDDGSAYARIESQDRKKIV